MIATTAAPTPEPPALQVQHVSRAIGARALLHDVSLDVGRGLVVVLAGVNGAGKSSLLRAIGGRLRLDAGTITIAGLAAADARRAGRLGVVPQDIALDPHLSVRDNLRLWARLAGTPAPEVDARVDDGLRWADLADRARLRVDTLSGGMRRRLNLVAGLLHQPPVLLLDEPTAGLDADARRQVYALVDDLRRQRVTLLIATHEIDELAGRCDLVAVMAGGRVVARDTPDALVARHTAPGGEWVIGLAADADAGASAALGRAGFAPAGPRDWTRADGGTDLEPRRLHRDLADQGVAVREIRWRRATLETAVSAISARHREATP